MKLSIRQILKDAVLRLLGYKPHYSCMPWYWRVAFLGAYLRTWYRLDAALAGEVVGTYDCGCPVIEGTYDGKVLAICPKHALAGKETTDG